MRRMKQEARTKKARISKQKETIKNNEGSKEKAKKNIISNEAAIKKQLGGNMEARRRNQ